MELSTRKLVGGILLLVLVGGAMLLYAYQGNRFSAVDEATMKESTLPHESSRGGTIEEISATHFYTEEDREHTLIGTVPVPTPCHELRTNVRMVEGTDGKDRATISFDAVNNSQAACVQVVTAKTFKVRFRGEENISVQILWNGAPVDIAIERAAPGSDPDLL